MQAVDGKMYAQGLKLDICVLVRFAPAFLAPFLGMEKSAMHACEVFLKYSEYSIMDRRKAKKLYALEAM